jgi:hypothetical protein
VTLPVLCGDDTETSVRLTIHRYGTSDEPDVFIALIEPAAAPVVATITGSPASATAPREHRVPDPRAT